MAVSLYAGPEHIVSYFLSTDNQCKLTPMIAERSDDEKDSSSAQVSRIQVAVDVGATARLVAVCLRGGRASDDRLFGRPDRALSRDEMIVARMRPNKFIPLRMILIALDNHRRFDGSRPG